LQKRRLGFALFTAFPAEKGRKKVAISEYGLVLVKLLKYIEKILNSGDETKAHVNLLLVIGEKGLALP